MKKIVLLLIMLMAFVAVKAEKFDVRKYFGVDINDSKEQIESKLKALNYNYRVSGDTIEVDNLNYGCIDTVDANFEFKDDKLTRFTYTGMTCYPDDFALEMEYGKEAIKFGKVGKFYTYDNVSILYVNSDSLKFIDISKNLFADDDESLNVKASIQTQCTATTKKGTRCKRFTKSKNGLCWQHGGD